MMLCKNLGFVRTCNPLEPGIWDSFGVDRQTWQKAEDFKSKSRSADREALDTILEILNARQRVLYNRMYGKKFDFQVFVGDFSLEKRQSTDSNEIKSV